MGTMIMVAQFMLSLCLLVILHEWGHFATARWFNTKVEKFYLFFNPWFSLVKKKIGETEYGIGWLPLGGYVKIAGMIDESMDKEQMKGPVQDWEFRAKPAWQRLIIMLGGIIVNFLLGFFILGMMLWVWGEAYLPADAVKEGIVVDSLGYEMGLRDGDHILRVGEEDFTNFESSTVVKGIVLNEAKSITVDRQGSEHVLPIDPKWMGILTSFDMKDQALFTAPYPFEIAQVSKGSAAEEAGLLEGDRIMTIDDTPLPYAPQVYKELKRHPGETIRLGIERDGSPMVVEATLSEASKLGVSSYGPAKFYEMASQSYPLWKALPMGVSKGIHLLSQQIKAFGMMFSGKINVTESLGGPIAIAHLFPKYWDAQQFWYMTALLSLILAFMNLLPIPALDGGHVLFLLWEMITGRKPSDRFLEIMTMIGFVLLLILMIFIFGNDIRRFFF